MEFLHLTLSCAMRLLHGLLVQCPRKLTGNPVLPSRTEPVEGAILSVLLPAKPALVTHTITPVSNVRALC